METEFVLHLVKAVACFVNNLIFKASSKVYLHVFFKFVDSELIYHLDVLVSYTLALRSANSLLH